ncbi:MAG TPA: hypothetical protein PKA64_13495 [Myxococcota bacterium]|mgnify:CR=1 FL=1|jgi:hypothetical protein|nr:hypothetical protein [Myxococcota bacterium]
MKSILAISLLILSAVSCDPMEDADEEVTLREKPEEVLVATETISIKDFADIVAACQLEVVPVQLTYTSYAPAAEARVIGLGGSLYAHQQQYECWREIMVEKLGAIPW